MHFFYHFLKLIFDENEIFNRPDMQEIQHQIKEECIKNIFFKIMADDLLTTLKNPKIEQEIIDLNLQTRSQCFPLLREKVSLIFLNLAIYLRDDHIDLYVQRSVDYQPTFLKFLHHFIKFKSFEDPMSFYFSIKQLEILAKIIELFANSIFRLHQKTGESHGSLISSALK